MEGGAEKKEIAIQWETTLKKNRSANPQSNFYFSWLRASNLFLTTRVLKASRRTNPKGMRLAPIQFTDNYHSASSKAEEEGKQLWGTWGISTEILTELCSASFLFIYETLCSKPEIFFALYGKAEVQKGIWVWQLHSAESSDDYSKKPNFFWQNQPVLSFLLNFFFAVGCFGAL